MSLSIWINIWEQVINEILKLGNRITGIQNSALKDSKYELADYIFRQLREKDPDLAEIDVKIETSKKILVLAFSGVVGTIDMISRAIGDEFLVPTYEKVEVQPDFENFRHFLLDIKMNWFSRLKEEEIYKEFERLEKEPFAAIVLKYLTYRTLVFRQNSLSPQSIQKLCSKIGIEYKDVQFKKLGFSKRNRPDQNFD